MHCMYITFYTTQAVHNECEMNAENYGPHFSDEWKVRRARGGGMRVGQTGFDTKVFPALAPRASDRTHLVVQNLFILPKCW